jgi:hypothetical protein
MRSIRLTPRSKLLHIEAPGCIVNIDPGLTDSDGRMVCRVDVNADGDRYKGDAQWWVEGEAGNRGVGLRVIQTNTPAPPAGALKPDEREQVRDLLKAIAGCPQAAPWLARLDFEGTHLYAAIMDMVAKLGGWSMKSFRIEVQYRTRHGNPAAKTLNVTANDYNEAYALARDHVMKKYRPTKIDWSVVLGQPIPSGAAVPGVEKD